MFNSHLTITETYNMVFVLLFSDVFEGNNMG